MRVDKSENPGFVPIDLQAPAQVLHKRTDIVLPDPQVPGNKSSENLTLCRYKGEAWWHQSLLKLTAARAKPWSFGRSWRIDLLKENVSGGSWNECST